MKTKSIKKDTVNVITLGCSKNIVDSEMLMGQLHAAAVPVMHEGPDNEANVVVVNTCGFIDNAKEESINTILHYSDMKKAGTIDKLYVTGCLSQRYAPELSADISHVDGWYGTMDMPQLLKTLGVDYKHELVGERLLTTPKHYAYFKIAEGCDRPCSFCAIPIMRGTHKSQSIESLVSQAKTLAKNGTKELILIAQDLTYYGLDLYKDRKLPDLIRNLSDIDGIEWIRLQYAYPSGFPMEILDVMNERSNVCKYLDMPLQHISNDMLKSMRRGITTEKTIELVDKIRQKVPDIALRTTLISGYPGETEADFDTLKQFVSDTKFDRLGIFTYSHEENTHAHSLNDNVPAEIKQSRADEIMELQYDISYNLNQKKIGTTHKVLIDRKDQNSWVGRTQYDSPEVDNEVHIAAEDKVYLPIGQFYNVKITSADAYDIYGELV